MNLAYRGRISIQDADEMRSFLINKNLSLYYWLRKRIGKKNALKIARAIESVILFFGRATFEGEKT